MNKVINKEVEIRHLGLVDYKEAWDYQEKLFNNIVNIKIKNRKFPTEQHQKTPNYILICEHPHVYTLGKSGDISNLLIDGNGLTKNKASFYKINRGGDITYHGPGQIVGYPIIDLENFFTDIHQYLRFLENAIIHVLRDYGLNAGTVDGLTGVWLDHEQGRNPRKICAIGVRTSRWVTMHGFAFNVNTDLEYFNNIVPCGIPNKQVTSLENELGKKIPVNEVEQKVITALTGIFKMELSNDQ